MGLGGGRGVKARSMKVLGTELELGAVSSRYSLPLLHKEVLAEVSGRICPGLGMGLGINMCTEHHHDQPERLESLTTSLPSETAMHGSSPSPI